ncbi:MAG TPA: hypothetical protein VJW20_04200 [Candidatus Angelobacter sp.]|nr:hypothetical protein [Candidatus Angelobacter sp.]
MRRDLLLVLLLVLLPAMGVGQADKKPGTENPAGAAKPQVKTKAVKGKKQEAQVKTKAHEGTVKAQAEKKKVQAQTDTAQAKTEAVPEQTEAAQAQTEEPQAQTEEPQAQTDQAPKLTSVPGGKALGMSVLGNQEAPTSLVIVPWKSSEVGRATGISPMLDDSRQPVDKEVFMRELRYYEIRSEKKP